MNQNHKIHGAYHDDDIPVGRLLSRREVLALFGSVGTVAILSACGSSDSGSPSPSEEEADQSAVVTTNSTLPQGCVVRPELEEGPVFVEQDLNRADIRTDPSNGAVSEGSQLNLTFRVTQIADGTCTPLSGVQVDIWHCDANGVYSDTDQLGFRTVGQKFLRGYQTTDANGIASFTTIYPGWYEGRAVHIHFKMRTSSGYDFTSQLFFDEAFTDGVFAQAPYNTRGERELRNEDDYIFAESDDQMMLAVNQVESGYEATFDVALDLT